MREGEGESERKKRNSLKEIDRRTQSGVQKKEREIVKKTQKNGWLREKKRNFNQKFKNYSSELN